MVTSIEATLLTISFLSVPITLLHRAKHGVLTPAQHRSCCLTADMRKQAAAPT